MSTSPAPDPTTQAADTVDQQILETVEKPESNPWGKVAPPTDHPDFANKTSDTWSSAPSVEPTDPSRNNRTTLFIVSGIVLVILALCCCCAFFAASPLFMLNSLASHDRFDRFDNSFSQPYLYPYDVMPEYPDNPNYYNDVCPFNDQCPQDGSCSNGYLNDWGRRDYQGGVAPNRPEKNPFGDSSYETYHASANDIVTIDDVSFILDKVGRGSVLIKISNNSRQTVTIPIETGWMALDTSREPLPYTSTEIGNESKKGVVEPGQTYEVELTFTKAMGGGASPIVVAARLNNLLDGYKTIVWLLE
jgi:hypothetical protein